MKYLIFILINSIFIFSCSVNKKISRNYYYVEPFKEQQIKLSLESDSTFRFTDDFGCNKFLFFGKYRQAIINKITYIIFDSVDSKISLPNLQPKNVFVINNNDTATIVYDERLAIHGEPFIYASGKKINKIDLDEIRYKKIKDYYINLFGKKGFYKQFGGDGESENEIKKKILNCDVD